MTTYRRRGHWRRSPGGRRHWVGTHYVTRSGATGTGSPGWSQQSSRTSSTPVFYAQPPVRQPPRSFSERWLRPNARCPVCGASVFFYSNEYGSRVFFDEVGPPWPKHPCTDKSRYHEYPIPVGRIVPVRYGFNTGRSLVQTATRRDSTTNSGLTPIGQTYRFNAWTPYSVLKLEVERDETRPTLRELYTRQPATVWMAPSVVSLAKGDVAFIKAGQMSYFDIVRGEATFMSVVHLGVVPAPGIRARLRRYWSRLTAERME